MTLIAEFIPFYRGPHRRIRGAAVKIENRGGGGNA